MRTETARGGRRAQLVVVTALVLAAVLVGLALVVNAGIYSENLSTRETTDSGSAVSFVLEAEAAIADAARTANGADAATVDDASAAFDGAFDPWLAARSNEAATRGASASARTDPAFGWHLRQETDRSFTPADDSSAREWQVVHGADGVGAFALDVRRGSLYDASADFDRTADEAFNVTVVGDTTWRLYVFRDSTNGSVVVHAGDPGVYADLGELRDSDDSCTADTTRAVVELRAETLAGADCPALNFSDDVAGSVDVHFGNVRDDTDGERVNGTYELVVDGPTAVAPRTDGQPDEFNPPGGDDPTAQAVVYAVGYAASYERSDVTLDRTGRHADRAETYAG